MTDKSTAPIQGTAYETKDATGQAGVANRDVRSEPKSNLHQRVGSVLSHLRCKGCFISAMLERRNNRELIVERLEVSG